MSITARRAFFLCQNVDEFLWRYRSEFVRRFLFTSFPCSECWAIYGTRADVTVTITKQKLKGAQAL
nr:MAG TPA: hypothetical protein [Caudoviricetes sp.]